MKSLPIYQKVYMFITAVVSSILSYHVELKDSLIIFSIVVVLDSLTRVHANAKKKGLVFNPFAKYFWKEISSKGLRDMCEKVFLEYGIYLLVAFAVDNYILDRMVLFKFNDIHLTLPILALWIFSFIEIWSIAENVEDAGGRNIFKVAYELFPEKLQKILDNLKNDERKQQNNNNS